MNVINKKGELRERRHKKIRSKIQGDANIPRLSVYRSNTNINVQLIDDVAGKTIIATGTKTIKGLKGTGVEKAEKVGEEIAKKAKELGITKVVFDRGGYIYQGRVKAVADGARKGGLIL